MNLVICLLISYFCLLVYLLTYLISETSPNLSNVSKSYLLSIQNILRLISIATRFVVKGRLTLSSSEHIFTCHSTWNGLSKSANRDLKRFGKAAVYVITFCYIMKFEKPLFCKCVLKMTGLNPWTDLGYCIGACCMSDAMSMRSWAYL